MIILSSIPFILVVLISCSSAASPPKKSPPPKPSTEAPKPPTGGGLVTPKPTESVVPPKPDGGGPVPPKPPTGGGLVTPEATDTVVPPRKPHLPHILPLFPTKINKTAYLKVIKENPAIYTTSRPGKWKSVFQDLQVAYKRYYDIYVREAYSLSTQVHDGMGDVLDACKTCKATVIGKDRTQCYANCITRKMDALVPYALLIGEVAYNLFCVPLGFGFESQVLSNAPWLTDFFEFLQLFNMNKESFSMSSLIETWMSNLLWIGKSPMYVHSVIRSQLAVDIASLQEQNGKSSVKMLGTGETPAKFSEKCGSQWDLREVIYSIANAAKGKSHYLDVVLRGLYTVRGAAFYTFGEYHNLFGGVLEGLNAMIGTKCDIISYSEGGEITNSTCDSFGRYPVPQFPVPPAFAHQLQPCEYDNVMLD